MNGREDDEEEKVAKKILHRWIFEHYFTGIYVRHRMKWKIFGMIYKYTETGTERKRKNFSNLK